MSWLNRVHCADSRDLSFIPDESVGLVVTSPPYNVGMGYEEDQNFEQWCDMTLNVFVACYAKVIPGGRIAVNIANTDRKPYRMLSHTVWHSLQSVGFIPRGEIIWDKGASVGTSTAWGSWRRPTGPSLRDVHEYILVAQKPGAYPGKGFSDITAAEFTEYTKSIWTFPTVSAKKIGHEAPFPLELPRRLIRLYTYPGDAVLDPFCGAGTTLLAAKELGRNYVGVDADPASVALSEEYLSGQRTRPDALKGVAAS